MAFAQSPAIKEMKVLREANQQSRDNKEGNKNFLSALLAAFPKINPAIMKSLETQSDAELIAKLYSFRYLFNELNQKKIEDRLSGIWKASNKDWSTFAEGVIALNPKSLILKDAVEFAALTAEESKSAFNAKAFITELFNHFLFDDLLDEAGYINPEAKANLEQAHKALDLLKPTVIPDAQEPVVVPSHYAAVLPPKNEAAPVAHDDSQIPLSDSRKAPEEEKAPAQEEAQDKKEEAPKAPAKAAPAPAVEAKPKNTIKKIEKSVSSLISALETASGKEAGDNILDLLIYSVDKKKAVAEDALELLEKVMKAYQKNNYSLYTALVGFLNRYTHIKCEEVESKLKKKTHTISVRTKALTPAFGAFYARGILPKQEGIFFTATGEQTSGDLFLTLEYFMSKAKEDAPKPSDEDKALKAAQRYIAPIKAEAPAKVVDALKLLSEEEYEAAKKHLEELTAAFEKVEAERKAQATA